MSLLIISETKVRITPDVFSKAEGDKLHILTFSSEHLVTLDEQGKEIWELLLEKGELLFSDLIDICKEDYVDFGDDEEKWISEFILELHTLGLILLK